jgi:hypothetical protein
MAAYGENPMATVTAGRVSTRSARTDFSRWSAAHPHLVVWSFHVSLHAFTKLARKSEGHPDELHAQTPVIPRIGMANPTSAINT